MDLLLAFLIILFALHPVGKASLFIAELHLLQPADRRRIALRELLLALALMTAFLAGATILLRQVGRMPLLVVGGVVLAAMGVRRIVHGSGVVRAEAARHDPIFFPLAFPYIAGPSVLAGELLLAARDPERWPVWGTGAYLAWLVSAVCLYHAPRVQAALGERGVRLLGFVAGVGLLLAAVELFLYGSLQSPGLIPTPD